MGISFESAHGSAKKNDLGYLKLEEGINEFRMVGELRPRYAYWKKLRDNSIPVECLSFDPKEEKFNNLEKDWFKHYFPEEKCVWSYVIQVIDKNNELKLCGLKKKLFDQIMTAARKLGDPTDPETGWSVKVNKKRTGPHAFNIEYELLQLELEKMPLTDEQREAFDKVKPIDQLVPRMSAEEQRAFIEQAWMGDKEESNVDTEAVNELDDEDIPF
jgi:hypothetical protein